MLNQKNHQLISLAGRKGTLVERYGVRDLIGKKGMGRSADRRREEELRTLWVLGFEKKKSRTTPPPQKNLGKAAIMSLT